MNDALLRRLPYPLFSMCTITDGQKCDTYKQRYDNYKQSRYTFQ